MQKQCTDCSSYLEMWFCTSGRRACHVLLGSFSCLQLTRYCHCLKVCLCISLLVTNTKNPQKSIEVKQSVIFKTLNRLALSLSSVLVLCLINRCSALKGEMYLAHLPTKCFLVQKIIHEPVPCRLSTCAVDSLFLILQSIILYYYAKTWSVGTEVSKG